MVKNTKSVDGVVLRDFRKSMGWSQKELAESLTPPVTQGTISAYENGKLHTPRKFSVGELEELCEAIGTEKVKCKARTRTKNSKYMQGEVVHLSDDQVIKGEKVLNTSYTEDSILVAMRERMIAMLKDDKKFDALGIKYLTESYSMFKDSCSNK